MLLTSVLWYLLLLPICVPCAFWYQPYSVFFPIVLKCSHIGDNNSDLFCCSCSPRTDNGLHECICSVILLRNSNIVIWLKWFWVFCVRFLFTCYQALPFFLLHFFLLLCCFLHVICHLWSVFVHIVVAAFLVNWNAVTLMYQIYSVNIWICLVLVLDFVSILCAGLIFILFSLFCKTNKKTTNKQKILI